MRVRAALQIPLEAFSGPLAGEVMTGIVTDVWLYHGLQVDLGGVWDG